jgi:hypothetical protein
MKLFEIRTPDGRTMRQQHPSLEQVQGSLLAGYQVTGTVIGAASDNSGGWVDPIEGPSIMAQLLEAHGDELCEWLRTNGTVRAVKHK